MDKFVYPQGYALIAGVDEVGRGPLVGAVVTAAVILDPNNPIEGLADSKKLSEKKRLLLAEEIKQKALAWALGRAEPHEIDELNILHASMLAMERAVKHLKIQPHFVLVDGNRIPPNLSIPAQAVVKGDALVAEISAASILAKVARDQEMLELDQQYPQYAFAQHKGYPTKLHLEKITEFGLDARSFAGVRIAAVGTKTAAAIRELGITPELLPSPTQQNAAGLVEVFPEYDEDLDPVGRVLLPRADIATDVLVDGLANLGWEVEDIVAYRTVRAAPPSAEIRDMIKSGGFDAVCFTSSSTVRNLVGIAGKPHQRTIIACIGPMAAATARELGLRVDVQPEIAGVDELVDALAEHVAGLRAAGQLPPPRKKRRSRKAKTQ